MRKAIAALLCLSLMPAYVTEASAQDTALQARAAQIVDTLSHGEQHVVRVFPGPDGLLGAVIENAAKEQDIAWLTPHVEAALAGSLLGRHGEDLTREAKIQQDLILSPKDVLKQSLNPARHDFLVGTGGPVLTVFFDPNCVYCHQLYGALSPAIVAGRVRIRFVIVGTLKASSTPRAASLLAAKDPAQALALNEQHYDASHEEGGFPIASTIDPAMVEVVSGNSALFNKAGMVGTPSILYCDKTGATQMAPGVPGDIPSFVAKAGICP